MRLRSLVAPAVGLAVFFGVWQAYVRLFDVKPVVLPAPTEIVRYVVEHPRFFWDNAVVTGTEAVLGLVVAFVAGMLLATMMAHSRFAERATLPVLVLVQVTPIIAIAPALITWLGLGLLSKVVIAALAAVVPFAVSGTTGLRAIDPAAHELLRSVDASGTEIYRRLRVPHALPYVFSAAKVSVGLALIGAVIAEWFGGREGLGFHIRFAQQRLDVLTLWGAIMTLAALGVVLLFALRVAESLLLRWHTSQLP